MVLKTRIICNGLKQKGFHQREGDHHFFVYYTIEGKKTNIWTKTSHSTDEINDTLISKMRKQIRLATNSNFKELVECDLSQTDYEKFLKSSGEL